MNTITNLDDLIDFFSILGNRETNIIVFTTGKFNKFIHEGHVGYLRAAKNLGTILIVGLRTEKWIETEKKKPTEIVDWEKRANVLSEFRSVDYIIPVDSPEQMHFIISELNPDKIVTSKSDSNSSTKSPAVMESFYGSKVVVFEPFSELHSSDAGVLLSNE